jgi:hypothetical protein
MAAARGGYIQQLPNGSFCVSVYAGTNPLTGRQIRPRKTCKTDKTERAAQVELGRLLEQAAAGRQPGTDATVAQLMDRYTEVADWDLSTRKANEVYIRRVIKPALGHLQVRKIRGPLLDLLYAQLRRCSDPGCTGKRFIEHRNVPLLAVDPGSRRRRRLRLRSQRGPDHRRNTEPSCGATGGYPGMNAACPARKNTTGPDIHSRALPAGSVRADLSDGLPPGNV